MKNYKIEQIIEDIVVILMFFFGGPFLAAYYVWVHFVGLTLGTAIICIICCYFFFAITQMLYKEYKNKK